MQLTPPEDTIRSIGPPVNSPHVTFRHINSLYLCSGTEYRTIDTGNECPQIVRYGTSRAHCRYLEANANNLTLEMHEPIYGCSRHGLAPEP